MDTMIEEAERAILAQGLDHIERQLNGGLNPPMWQIRALLHIAKDYERIIAYQIEVIERLEVEKANAQY